MGGWRSVREYVEYFVPRIGYGPTAQALGMDRSTLRKRYPGLGDGGESVSDQIRRERAERRLAKRPTIICAECGAEVLRTSGFQKYCKECGSRRDRESRRAAAIAASRKKSERRDKTIVCEMCGRRVERTGSTQRFCPECRKIHARQHRVEYEAKRRQRQREADSRPDGNENE